MSIIIKENVEFEARTMTVLELKNAVTKLRALSPLWDMYKDGVDLKSVKWAAH